jgi:hypothetical protein
MRSHWHFDSYSSNNCSSGTLKAHMKFFSKYVKIQVPCFLMTRKYRGCIVVLSINKSVEPNEEQKVLTSGFDQGFTINTSKRVFRGIW